MINQLLIFSKKLADFNRTGPTKESLLIIPKESSSKSRFMGYPILRHDSLHHGILHLVGYQWAGNIMLPTEVLPLEMSNSNEFRNLLELELVQWNN